MIMDIDRKLPGFKYFTHVILALACLEYYADAVAPSITTVPVESYIVKKENFTIGGLLWSVTVNDTDPNEHLTVTMDPQTRRFVDISKSSGPSLLQFNVTLKIELDKETFTAATIQLQFTVTDGDGNEAILKKDIYITEINDNTPIFQDVPYTWDIPELPHNASSYYTFSATDLDKTGGFGDLTFTMEPTTQSQLRRTMYKETFSLTTEFGNVGKVSLQKPLDYKTNSYYQFTITATDGGGLNATTALVIRVLDVQNQPPFFNNMPYRATIKEGTPPGSSVIQVDAQDGDLGVSNQVTYKLGGQCSNLFQITSDGSITTKSSIDRDSGVIQTLSGSCKLQVTASEINETQHEQYGPTVATANVTVEIEDINDNPPMFNVQRVNAEVPENTPANVPITLKTTLNVSDVDQGTNVIISLALEWMNGTQCDAFTPVPQTVSRNGIVGISVKTSSLLDYETRHNLTFKIVAANPSNSNFKDEVQVDLQITDVNDNNPEFGNIRNEFYIVENSPNATQIATITASDKDSTSSGKLVYSITGGSERFHVDPTAGVITTVCSSNCSQEFDRERYSAFTVAYSVKDEGGRQDFVSLTVHLNDSNDNTPTFYRKEYRSFINENDGQYVAKTPVVILDGSDKDETLPNNNITFSLLPARTTYPPVRLDPTGKLYLTEAVNYEKLPNLTTGEIHIDVMVTDGGEPQRNSTATVVITVQDENDNEPLFTSAVFLASIPEDATSNTTTQTHVSNIKATDTDGTKRNSDFHYFIVEGAYEKFAINSTTGEVTVQINAKLDREATSLYNVTLNAIDQGSPAFTSTASLIVTITDVNDEDPSFDSKVGYTGEILEDANIGQSVTTVHASDQDDDNNLVYNITGVAATDENGKAVNKSLVLDYFSIHTDNGTVYVKSGLDRETAAVVTLTLRVQDMNAVHNKPQTDTAQLRIKLLDVNDNDPTFQNISYRVSVPENAPSPDILLQLTATDRDINRTINYTLNNGPIPTNSFAIEPLSGKLKKTGALDREVNGSVTLSVMAIDSGVPSRNSTVDVHVTITDVNDNAPIFTSTVKTIHVSEDAPKGWPVINMNATDDDGPPDNNNITYSINSGGRGNFTINSTTGLISLKTMLDRESVAAYTMIILAQDNPKDHTLQKSSTTTLTVTIDDVNDKKPTFKQTSYTASVLENVNNGTSVITVTAGDEDKPGTNNSRVEYSFHNDSTLFIINKTTGEIAVNAVLKDRVNNYTLIVIAKDFGSPQLQGNTTVRINVKDVNWWPPVIGHIPSQNTIDVFECVPPNKVFYTFNYTDKDFGVNHDAAFKLDSSNTFAISTGGELMTAAKLDASIQVLYNLEIQATDKGEPPLGTKVKITIRVLDVNDHPPEFNPPHSDVAIQENKTDVILTTVSAIDVDKNSNSCYSIPSGQTWENQLNISDLFNVSETTGEIFVTEALDYETTKRLQFVVHVRDCSAQIDTRDMCSNDTKFASVNPNITVKVAVSDIDDNPPTFVTETISVGMKRKVEPGTILNLHLKTRDSPYISDLDSPRHGYQSWVFANDGHIIPSSNIVGFNTSSGVKACGANGTIKHIFCIDGNGTLSNNKFFSEDMFGYFRVPVRVSDQAGSSTAFIKVYLIGDSQILMMTVLDKKEAVSIIKDDILKGYSAVTGLTFVYDGIEDHKDGDVPDPNRSDLYFHVVGKDENVLSAKEAEALVDKNAEHLTAVMRKYGVTQVQSGHDMANDGDDTMLKFYVAIAAAVVLFVTLMLVAYAGIVTKNKYQRKLKAATIKSVDTSREMVDGSMAIPGSNQYSKQANPLLNAKVVAEKEEQYDKLSLSSSNNSIDVNEVDDPRSHETVYDAMEEREVTLDMFTEDTYLGGATQHGEDPLSAALRIHELNKSRETLNDDFDDGHVSDVDDHVTGSYGGGRPLAYGNLAYDDMESTEI